MNVHLFARVVREDYQSSVQKVLASASSFGWDLSASSNLIPLINGLEADCKVKEVEGYEQLKRVGADVVITFGGDGTILDVTKTVRDLAIPIAGINLGRLGFLASIEQRSIDSAMQLIHERQYNIEERRMLHLESDPQVFGEMNFALNDFTIHKRDTSSMISIHTYVNGDFLTTYWADGLIVATPTGSTGYSLSCGGPIIFPSSGNMVITPVAPHNLNVRPLVISDESVITFNVEGRAKNFLCTLDSRYETITANHQLAVRKCDFNTRLISFKGETFQQTIHEKLSWGADQRN